jgi:hypothetical protein
LVYDVVGFADQIGNSFILTPFCVMLEAKKSSTFTSLATYRKRVSFFCCEMHSAGLEPAARNLEGCCSILSELRMREIRDCHKRAEKTRIGKQTLETKLLNY